LEARIFLFSLTSMKRMIQAQTMESRAKPADAPKPIP
jgi:hypothetical protein